MWDIKKKEENMMRKIRLLLLLLLLLPLPPAPLSVDARGLISVKYIHYHQYKTWYEAQAFCRKNHLDLVTIKKEKLNIGRSRCWIGLHREDSHSEWKWCRGDEKATYTNWRQGEPRNINCAFKQHNALQWVGYSCSTSDKFWCYDDALVLVQKNKTWEEALQRCRSLELNAGNPLTDYQSHTADLVSVLTSEDYDYTRDKAQEATTDEVWIGFLAGEWLWVSGEKESTDVHECPAELCGTLKKNDTQTYQRRSCQEKRNFLCYRKSSADSQ
ncbi:hypothetical protein LDENG_00232770 [Lucifuga dentata]|nr:hypothetical protein LDENG_00232770 [Lucifuga dentata]